MYRICISGRRKDQVALLHSGRGKATPESHLTTSLQAWSMVLSTGLEVIESDMLTIKTSFETWDSSYDAEGCVNSSVDLRLQ